MLEPSTQDAAKDLTALEGDPFAAVGVLEHVESARDHEHPDQPAQPIVTGGVGRSPCGLTGLASVTWPPLLQPVDVPHLC